MSHPSDQDPAQDPTGSTPPEAGPPWAGRQGWPRTPGGRIVDRLAGLYGDYQAPPAHQTPPGQPVPQGRRTGRLAVILGAVGLVTSIAVVGGVVGVVAIVLGMRARAHARRGGAGAGTGTAGLVLGILSVFVAFTVAGGTWVFYERHGDDLRQYQDCRRDARSAQELDECSRRFSEAVRTDPTSKG